MAKEYIWAKQVLAEVDNYTHTDLLKMLYFLCDISFHAVKTITIHVLMQIVSKILVSFFSVRGGSKVKRNSVEQRTNPEL